MRSRTTALLMALFVAPLTRGETTLDEKQRGSRFLPGWDNYSDTWTATDALGRRVATFKDVGPAREDRWVGIFYFLWLGAHVNGGPYDVSRILKIDPEAMSKKDSPLWGPLSAPHHWGEPLFGYYVDDDAWVLRKHAAMLADAGVDTLIFDTSNKVIYENYYTALFEVLVQSRAEGNRTPYVAFLTPFWDPTSTVQELYDKLYSKGLYKELWFHWEGKPLILADPAKVNPDLRGFFTFRRPQPSYFEGSTEPNMWSWLEVHPQHVFLNDRGEKEQMSVGAAQNAVKDEKGVRLGTMSEPGALGRSFHNGAFSEDPKDLLAGANVTEQWERVLKEDPYFTFITGWNEWFAGRFEEFLGVKMPVMFVDTFDQEHSRDIEPMRGGHGDNYYYQMVHYIRRFKGARPQAPASPTKTVDLAGPFSQWDDVGPEYRDTLGDTAHRNHPGYNTQTRTVNNTGRNDFEMMKVCQDEENLYFYAKTRQAITSHTDPDWMVLFIDIDRDPTTGWHGYDFAINRRVLNGEKSVVERTDHGWNWQPAGEARFRVTDRELMLAIPRKTLGLPQGQASLAFEFKWADDFQVNDDIFAFTLNGDSAPPGRFNFFYVAE